MNERELVLNILLAINEDGEYSHRALKRTLDRHQALSKQERAFITRVCEGTLEHMIWITYVLDHFSSVKVEMMKPVIRTILISGVYELKFMDSVPVSATCNEAVKLAQKRGFRNLKGFVNGILRNISRNLDQLPMPDKAETLKWMSIRYSMPEWILRQWKERYPWEQIEEMLEAFLKPHPTSIRVNTLKTTKEALTQQLVEEGVCVIDPASSTGQASEVREIPDALYLTKYDSLNRLNSFRQGLFYVQDPSSMLVALCAGIKPGDYVIDVCAAPGGKSLHAALLMTYVDSQENRIKESLSGGMVEARDLTEYKVGLIQENIDRCGLPNIQARRADARILQLSDKEKADVVMADLPCSGLGVLGKKKDIKYKMTPEKQKELIALQRSILKSAQEIVKPGGVLLYSTCTIYVGENEENTAWFLKEHPSFTLEHEEQILPRMEGHWGDGFYIAKLRKRKKPPCK